MKNNKMKYNATILSVFLFGIFILNACKKEDSPAVVTPAPVENTGVASGTRVELTKDSIFLYSKELYYWYNSLPTYDAFKPRNFSSDETELFALTQFSNNPITGKPYEYVANSSDPKYSYFDYLSTKTKVATLKADVSGTANDYGFSAMYNSTTDLRVKYVYPNSPASAQGLSRGCKIIAVNGNSNLTYSSSVITFLNAAIFGTNPSLSMSFIDLNGNIKNVTINANQYVINPILYINIFTVGVKKVGYIVFNSFTANATTALNTAFANFASQGATEVIVDLRYNGGGYVSTAAQIINILAPTAQNGNTMFTYYYNDYLQNLTTAQRKSSILVNQPLLDDSGNLQTYTNGVNGKYSTYADLDYKSTSADNIEKFAKSGTLNLNRVYFIVTSSTASASELTINSLKPVMDVKLIGSTTYGKPVGFFPIRIDKLDMYIPEFETKNQVGTGGYYSGLTVDKEASENLTKAWGDETETLLAYALLYAKNGSFLTTPIKTASLKATSSVMATKLSAETIKIVEESLDQNNFKGMIKTPARKF